MYSPPIDRVCQDCGTTLSPRATYCGCGWGKKKRVDTQPFDPRCAYENNAERCRYPGSISAGTLGGGPWYCRVHIRERGTQFARQALDASQSYREPPPVTPGDLLNDDLKELTWLTENFPMNPGETRQEYNMRCKEFALSNLRKFSIKPVVSNAPAKAETKHADLVEF